MFTAFDCEFLQPQLSIKINSGGGSDRVISIKPANNIFFRSFSAREPLNWVSSAVLFNARVQHRKHSEFFGLAKL